MDDVTASNGHHPDRRERVRSVNPYADAYVGDRPPEIVEYEMNSDPYANMLPRLTSVTSTGVGDDERDERRKRNPFVVAISILLIAVLVLPVMVEVFARLLH